MNRGASNLLPKQQTAAASDHCPITGARTSLTLDPRNREEHGGLGAEGSYVEAVPRPFGNCCAEES
jgi:hypothetical protein